MAAYKKKGFSIGIFIFLVMQFMSPPSGLSAVGWDVASVAVLMAIWWATETVPVAITALLPLALFPLLDVTSFDNAALPYWVVLCLLLELKVQDYIKELLLK